MSKDIYIDANIFISVFLERAGHEKIRKFFDGKFGDISSLNFVTSDWTLTEIVRVLVTRYKIDSEKVAAYVEELSRVRRICGVRFKFIDVSSIDGYDFAEFFYDIQKTVLEYGNGVPDAIHSQIMKNNGIGMILTSDSGFEGLDGVEVVNPLQI